MNNFTSKTPKELKLLLAYQNPSSFREEWRNLLIKALKMAYSAEDFEFANELIKLAPNDDWAWSSAEWFKSLGLDVRLRMSDLNELSVYGLVDRKYQRKFIQMSATKPLVIIKSQVKMSRAKVKDRWLDDLEAENRSQSIRAFQGGRVSGK